MSVGGPSDAPRDRAAAARAVEEFLRALGYDLVGELVGTPERVAEAWLTELVRGEKEDPVEILRAGTLEAGIDRGPIVLRRLAVSTMCPHHLLPSHGFATVGYFPNQRIAGLGAIYAALDACARRLILQESLGDLVAESLLRGLDARGAFCRLSLVHTCFVSRGERQANAVVETLTWKGSCVDVDRDLASKLAMDPQ